MVDLRYISVVGLSRIQALMERICAGWYRHISEFGKDGEDVAYLRGISMGVNSANVLMFQASPSHSFMFQHVEDSHFVPLFHISGSGPRYLSLF